MATFFNSVPSLPRISLFGDSDMDDLDLEDSISPIGKSEKQDNDLMSFKKIFDDKW